MWSACRMLIWCCLLYQLDSTGAVYSTRFLVLGDWGGLPTRPYKTLIEDNVAKQMGEVADTFGPQFILALGDNFYYDGVKNIDDDRFKETYENVFTSKSLMVPWYVVAGNHDHNGNVSAQIAYSNVEPRWNFPNYYYKLSKTVPGGATLDIIMIDTVLLCGNTAGDADFSQPRGPDDAVLADTQLTWIEKMIQTSTADFLLVAGHYPVYSIAEHGPTQCLIKNLLPLLEKYQATAYLCGHDHNLQHLEVENSGFTSEFFVVGAANFADPSRKHFLSIPVGSSKFFWSKKEDYGGFAYVEAVNSNMTLTYINGRGQRLYQKVLFPRKK